MTPESTLLKARETAMAAGLSYVYIGNVPGSEGETTRCPRDGTVLVRRVGFTVEESSIEDGRCPECGREVAGVWK
jgi:pyruvate formate lyase activating enzyme